ncbi:MAG: C-type lectin domain-containing protein [Candidatus Nanopelagicales bacterium]
MEELTRGWRRAGTVALTLLAVLAAGLWVPPAAQAAGLSLGEEADNALSLSRNENLAVSDGLDAGSKLEVSGFGSNSVRVVVQATSGTVALTTTTGLTYPMGYPAGYSGTEIAFIGTQTNVNAALTTMKFNPGDSLTPGTIKISAAIDGGTTVFNPDNGHYYYYYSGSSLTWANAEAAAEAATFQGMNGYLATVTSAAEQSFIVSHVLASGSYFIGGSDAAVEGSWKWVVGPESERFIFWKSGVVGCTVGLIGTCSPEGTARYSNWYFGQPDSGGGAATDYLQHSTTGWDDRLDTYASNSMREFSTTDGSVNPLTSVARTLNFTVSELSLTLGNEFDNSLVVSRAQSANINSALDANSGVRATGFGAFPVRMVVKATKGTVALTTTTGLTYPTGYPSNYTGSEIAFVGTQDQVNAALDAMTFSTDAASPGTIRITAAIDGGTAGTFNPDNGHYYYYTSTLTTWDAAKTTSEAASFRGLPGYLGNITSWAEQSFLNEHMATPPGEYYLGASDAVAQGTIEGVWKWVTGPASERTVFWQTGSPLCVLGLQGVCRPDGGTERFNNWYAALPDNYGLLDNYLTGHYGTLNRWNDRYGTENLYALREYSLADGSADPLTTVTRTLSYTVSAATLTLGNESDNSISVPPTSATGVNVSLDSGSEVAGGGFGSFPVRVIVKPSAGTVALTTTTGLTYPTGYPSNYTGAEIAFVGTQAQVNAALATMTFTSANSNPGTIQITAAIDGGSSYVFNPDNGHYYGYYGTLMTWFPAKEAAANSVYQGMNGYLGTVTSQAEWSFVNAHTSPPGEYYLGGTDQETSQTWEWITGPAAERNVFWKLAVGGCTTGLKGYCSPAGTPRFNQWNSGQPDNAGLIENYLTGNYGSANEWNDRPADVWLYTMREYSLPDGAANPLTAVTRTLTFTVPPPSLGSGTDGYVSPVSTTTTVNAKLGTNSEVRPKYFPTGNVRTIVQASAGTVSLGTTTGLTAPTGYPGSFSGSEIAFVGTQAATSAALDALKFTAGASPVLATLKVSSAIDQSGYVFNPDNAHFYNIYGTTMAWTAAKSAAEAATYQNMTGYLGTVTSQAEQNFINTKVVPGAAYWLGGTDGETEGTWKWVTGPAAEQSIFWKLGVGGCTTGLQAYCTPESAARWNNWLAPNPAGIDGVLADHLGSSAAGYWKDYLDGTSNSSLREFSLADGSVDPTAAVSRTISINVLGAITVTGVVPGHTGLQVSFTTTGGQGVTNYAYSINGGPAVPLSPAQTESPVTIAGLANGTSVNVALSAIVPQGNGPASGAGTGTPTQYPPRPGGVTRSGTTLSWNGIEAQWFTTVKEYMVAYRPIGETQWYYYARGATARSLTLNNPGPRGVCSAANAAAGWTCTMGMNAPLTAGLTYQFGVVAFGTNGINPLSNNVPIPVGATYTP